MKIIKLLKLLFVVSIIAMLCGCGKVTSETGSSKAKPQTPIASITGTIDVLPEASKDGFTENDKDIYVVFTKIKPDGTEEELAWGKGQQAVKKESEIIKEIIPTKSWQTKKSIIDNAITNVVTVNPIESTINIQPTKNLEEKIKEKKKENKPKNNMQIPTQNIVNAYSFDKKDKEVKAAQGNLIYFNYIPSPNPRWEYTIKDVKKGPAYFVVRAYNKNNDKLLATFVDGSAISTSNTNITVGAMDILSTVRTYVLICAERNDGRIDYGKINLANLKKRVTKTLIKKMNYLLPDLRQDNFKNKDPKFKQIPKENIENELAEAIAKEDTSFDQYKVYVQNISNSMLNDDAKKMLLMQNPPQDELPKKIKQNSKFNLKDVNENLTPNIEDIVTKNDEINDL